MAMRRLGLLLLLSGILAFGCSERQVGLQPEGTGGSIGEQHNALLTVIAQAFPPAARNGATLDQFVAACCAGWADLAESESLPPVPAATRQAMVRAAVHDALLLRKQGILDPIRGTIPDGHRLVSLLVAAGGLTDREGAWLEGLIVAATTPRDKRLAASTLLEDYVRRHPLPESSPLLVDFLDIATHSARYWAERFPEKRFSLDSLIDGIGGIVGGTVGRWFSRGNQTVTKWSELL